MKTFIRIIAAILAILLPFVCMFTVAFATPAVYQDTFVGALGKKYERLTSLDEPKIVIVGGSSVAFGINSELIERYTGMPVVNFGLYAALGTKVMMDLAEAGIRKGDVVVLAPEMDPQTLSLYFNSDTTLKAMDGTPEMLRHLKTDNLLSVAGATFRFAGDKLNYLLRDTRPNVDENSAYAARYVNEYGDLTYPRLRNTMLGFYDENTPIRLDESVMSQEFINYINDFVKLCRYRGASVYFGFCPINKAAVQFPEDMTEDEYYTAFEDFLDEKLLCNRIGSLKDNVMGAGYFFDSNFHLNDFGVTAHTVRLLQELVLELDIDVNIDEPIPDEPSLDTTDITYDGPVDPNCRYFLFTRDISMATGADLGYTISGLSEIGKRQTTLTIPVAYEGIRVTSVSANALSGGKVESLIIPQTMRQFLVRDESGNVDANTLIFSFKDGCFNNTPTLREICIYNEYESTILPPQNFTGTSGRLIVRVPAGSSYASGYFWGEHGLTFRENLHITE